MANVPVFGGDVFTNPNTFTIQDQFTQVDTDRWTAIGTDSGTAVATDAEGGYATITASDETAADNDQTYLHTANEVFKFNTNKMCIARTSIKYSEANTDDANIFVGFASGFAAELIVDNGAGMRTTGDIAGIYKVDGGTKWIAIAQKNGTATTTTSTTTAGGTNWQDIEIALNPAGNSQVKVTYRINGEYLKDSNGNVIQHSVATASATEMEFGFGVKNGGANLETLLVRYAAIAGVR